MINLFESVRTNPSFNKLEIGDLLFAEYTCPIGSPKLDHWAQSDFLVHVLSGKKIWHTIDGNWNSETGDTLYFRKGASIIEQFFEVDFCLFMFFIPDDLIRSTVREFNLRSQEVLSATESIKSVARVQNDVQLTAFFESMRAYFSGREKPSEPVLRLKLKELIVSMLTGPRNRGVAAYFQSVAQAELPPVAELMEANFRYNLSLEDYAKLCHRSLSSFKRDFQKHFNEPPGRWLLRKRLEYAAALLHHSPMSVSEVAFESGFEDLSHFSRVFKERFKEPPVQYRLSLTPVELAR
jgi:AraC-like DNA-binding protein